MPRKGLCFQIRSYAWRNVSSSAILTIRLRKSPENTTITSAQISLFVPSITRSNLGSLSSSLWSLSDGPMSCRLSDRPVNLSLRVCVYKGESSWVAPKTPWLLTLELRSIYSIAVPSLSSRVSVRCSSWCD